MNIYSVCHRLAMTNLIISGYPLHIEVGRYNRTYPSDRICTVFNFICIANKVHFLLECPLYGGIRSSFTCTLNLERRFKQLAKDETFVPFFDIPRLLCTKTP